MIFVNTTLYKKQCSFQYLPVKSLKGPMCKIIITRLTEYELLMPRIILPILIIYH